MADDVSRLLEEAARARDEMRSFQAATALEQAAGKLREAGRHAEAVTVLKELVEIQPTRAAVYRIQIGEALASEGLVGEAIDALDALARELRTDARHEEVATVREALWRIEPSLPRVLAFARAAVTARQSGRALSALQRAYREDPARIDVLELLSWAFLSAGERDKAAAVRGELAGRYREALASGRGGADTSLERDTLRDRINGYLRAPREYRVGALDLAIEMAERNPLAADARRTLATVRAIFEDYEGAANEFLAAAAIARAAGHRDLALEILHEGRVHTSDHPLLRERE